MTPTLITPTLAAVLCPASLQHTGENANTSWTRLRGYGWGQLKARRVGKTWVDGVEIDGSEVGVAMVRFVA